MSSDAGTRSQRVELTAGSRWAARTLIAPVRLYQRWVSPALPERCKYHPTCSAYAVRAISDFGIVRGSVLACWRLVRCNPWSHGGYDPVAAQNIFAAQPGSSPSHISPTTTKAPANR